MKEFVNFLDAFNFGQVLFLIYHSSHVGMFSDVGVKNKDGATPLHFCARKKQTAASRVNLLYWQYFFIHVFFVLGSYYRLG